MQGHKLIRLLAALVAVMLFAAACSGEDGASPEATDAESEAAAEGGEFSVYTCEPTSLLPTNANEVCGTGVLDALFSGLVRYDEETSEPVNQMAASIEADEDQLNWTITIEEGWTFHDGTPVTAQSYVDAWNYGAYGPNAQVNSYFYAPIMGYDDVQCEMDEEGNCVADPAAETMSGLEVVDEHTFTVALAGPYSQFPLVIGAPAFYPLPEVFFEDPEAFNEAPVGNGPFEMDGEWVHDEHIRVQRYEDYAGDAALADAVEFRVYTDINTAYTDLLAGNVDVMPDIPPEQVTGAPDELGDRFITGDGSSFVYLGIPLYDDRFTDVSLRRALSLAIDRQGIVDALLPDRVPATGIVPSTVAGSRPDACGEWCEYDPERAAELLEEAGGFRGPLVLWFNAGAGHEQYMEAIANQLRDNLGITDITFETPQPPDYAASLGDYSITGPFRLAWVMDYPSPENFLLPLFHSEGGNNTGQYVNEDVDAALLAGNQAATMDEAMEHYHEAEDLVIEEMPVVPLFFDRVTAAHSDRVDNVIVDAFTRVNVADIRVVAE